MKYKRMKEIEFKRYIAGFSAIAIISTGLILTNKAHQENKTLKEYLTQSSPVTVSSVTVSTKINDMSNEDLANCCILVDRIFNQYLISKGLESNCDIFFYKNHPYAANIKYSGVTNITQNSSTGYISYSTDAFYKLNKTVEFNDLKLVVNHLNKMKNFAAGSDQYSPETIRVALKSLYSMLDLPADPFLNPGFFVLANDSYLLKEIQDNHSFEELDQFFTQKTKLENVQGTFVPNKDANDYDQVVLTIINNHLTPQATDKEL